MKTYNKKLKKVFMMRIKAWDGINNLIKIKLFSLYY